MCDVVIFDLVLLERRKLHQKRLEKTILPRLRVFLVSSGQ